MDLFTEQVPPELQESLEVVVARWSLNLTADRVELLDPRLEFTDEVEDFDVLVEPKREGKLNEFDSKFDG
jgi:hypothetical protein